MGISFYGVGCKLGSEFEEKWEGMVCYGEGLMFNMKHEKNLAKNFDENRCKRKCEIYRIINALMVYIR